MRTARPVKFRLYPENRSLFCPVHVWPDKAAMLAYFRRDRGKRFAEAHADAAAVASGREVYRVLPGKPMRKTGEFCEINCHRGELTEEIVSHEVAHAALRWRSRVGLAVGRDDDFGGHEDVSDAEERFCYALGRMVKQFTSNLRKHHVWAS